MLNNSIKVSYKEAINLVREASIEPKPDYPIADNVAASILVLANTISSQDLVDMKGVAKSIDGLGLEISRMKG